MRSEEYRNFIRIITKKALHKRFPQLEQRHLNEVAVTIAKAIHARFYGANVDGVESPIWRKEEPTIEAKELLNEEPISTKDEIAIKSAVDGLFSK